MTKKTKQRMLAISASLAGQLPFKQEQAMAFQPTLLATLLLGYYLGQGHSEKRAAEKAQKLAGEVMSE
jgi:hypothetical protein